MVSGCQMKYEMPKALLYMQPRTRHHKMLTRRLRRALSGIAVLFVLLTVVAVSKPGYAPQLQPISVKDLRDNWSLYHEMMKNYTSSVYDDLADSVGSLTSAITAPGDVRLLMTPAFTPDSWHKGKVLSRNRKYMSQLLSRKIDEPKGVELPRLESDRANATFVSLVRNSELVALMATIKQIEETFNNKFHYPYVFLNDRPFTDRFKKQIQSLTQSTCHFELVHQEDWDKPDFIDASKEQQGISQLEQKGVGYARMASYHNMCRYYSKGFYKHPRMKQFKYYWRLEPSTNYFCQLDYDVFKFMEKNDKVYGYVLSLYDSPDSVASLWPTTIEFLQEHPQYLHPNAAKTWLRENLLHPDHYKTAQGYSTCHFWSNFEIGDMDFFRAEAYTEWVEHLDRSGGFYYERWGDAPVHSIGLGLFADKTKIHWFRDIGYEHFPYFNCPVSDRCHGKCKAGKFSTFPNLDDQNCQPTWAQYEMTEKQLEMY